MYKLKFKYILTIAAMGYTEFPLRALSIAKLLAIRDISSRDDLAMDGLPSNSACVDIISIR